MTTDQPLPFSAPEPCLPETPAEVGPWSLAAEPLLPARHVMWASLGLIVVTLLELAFG